MRSPRNQLQGNSLKFDIFNELEQTQQSFKKSKFILKVTFSLPSPSSMLKRQQKREFTVLQTSSPLFHVIHFVKFLANFSGRNLINPKGLYQSTGKEKENWCHLFTSRSSNKREVLIRHFHVVVVQRRPRNLQNSVVYVQGCCVANLNLFVTCTSRKMHLICPLKFRLSIVFNFSWDGCNTHEK